MMVHKNIQQITTFMESVKFIKDGENYSRGHNTSYMKKGFKNPSKYSFINFTFQLIENMHRRNPSIDKNLNIFQKS